MVRCIEKLMQIDCTLVGKMGEENYAITPNRNGGMGKYMESLQLHTILTQREIYEDKRNSRKSKANSRVKQRKRIGEKPACNLW